MGGLIISLIILKPTPWQLIWMVAELHAWTAPNLSSEWSPFQEIWD